jgi:hypothetical protein
LGELAVGEEEGADVGAGRQFETALFEERDVLAEAEKFRVGVPAEGVLRVRFSLVPPQRWQIVKRPEVACVASQALGVSVVHAV